MNNKTSKTIEHVATTGPKVVDMYVSYHKEGYSGRGYYLHGMPKVIRDEGGWNVEEYDPMKGKYFKIEAVSRFNKNTFAMVCAGIKEHPAWAGMLSAILAENELEMIPVLIPSH